MAITHRDPFVAKIICGPRASLGSGYKPLQSETANRSLTSRTTGTFSVDADLLSQIKADTAFSSISSLTVTLSNAKIVEIVDSDVLENIRYRSRACIEAVQARRRAGFEVTMVSSALISDFSYSVSFSQAAHLDAAAKVDVLSNLAVRLGGGATRVGENSIQSKGLSLGIRDDEYLSALALTDVDETHMKRGSRIIEAGNAQYIDIIPDAPVVFPTDGQDGPAEFCEDGQCRLDLERVIGPPPIISRRRPEAARQ
ncbi:MAG: hypothetical protein ACRYGR_10385 [Janthinobacterium lividum]